MGYRDIELLAAASGNQAKFTQIGDALKRYASSIALSLFSDPVIRDDAIEHARVKVTEWLGTEMVMHVDHPWQYARKIVANSLFDSAKTRKLEGNTLDTKLRDGATVQQEMAWIDEGFAKLDDEGDGQDKEPGSGWRVFQIIDESYITVDPERWRPHKWVMGLEQLSKFQWWWGYGQWLEKFEGEYKVKCQSFRNASMEARKKVKEYNGKLWNKYDLITALVDSISGLSEKRVVQYFLWGFKPVDIARELNVSKPYISKVLSQKWLKLWGWDEPAIYQARLILFTHYLANQYEHTLSIIDKRRMRNVPLQVIGLLGEDNKLRAEWRSLDPTLRKFNYDMEKAPKELRDKDQAIEKKINDLEDQIRSEYQELATHPSLTNDGLYKKIVSSPQTKVYFHDLDKFEAESLVNICARYWGHWYPNKTIFEDWWMGWWYGSDDD